MIYYYINIIKIGGSIGFPVPRRKNLWLFDEKSQGISLWKPEKKEETEYV
jgi:hypothetical protein